MNRSQFNAFNVFARDLTKALRSVAQPKEKLRNNRQRRRTVRKSPKPLATTVRRQRPNRPARPTPNAMAQSTGAQPVSNQRNITNALAQRPRTDVLMGKGLSRGRNSIPKTAFDYISCRLNPLQHIGGLGIPDRSNFQKVVVDYKFYTDINITAAAATQTLLITPTFPCLMFVNTSSTSANFNDVAGNTVSFLTTVATGTQNAYVLASVVPQWSAFSQLAPGVLPTINPFAANQMRIVTQVARIIYTGQALVCSGQVSVSELKFAFNEGAVTQNAAAAIIPCIDNTGGQHNLSNAAGTISEVPAIYNTTANTVMQKETVMLRPEDGAVIMLRHNGDNYRWRPVSSYFMGSEGNASTASIGNFFGTCSPTSTNIVYPQIAAYDSDWSAALVNLSGFSANTTVRVEHYVCAEFTVEQGSTLEPFTIKPSAIDDQFFTIASHVAGKIPTAVPAKEGFEGMLMKALDLAVKVAPTVVSALL